MGLDADQLARFTMDARKVGPRDLAACAAQGAVGATTVGGTLAVAREVGIRFLGTGGIGGVHRGFPSPPDVSADIPMLARAQALAVASGAKSLLDVPATMELLETLGVPVLGFRTDTLPLFYSADGRPTVSCRVEDASEAARIAAAHSGDLGGGGHRAVLQYRRAREEERGDHGEGDRRQRLDELGLGHAAPSSHGCRMPQPARSTPANRKSPGDAPITIRS